MMLANGLGWFVDDCLLLSHTPSRFQLNPRSIVTVFRDACSCMYNNDVRHVLLGPVCKPPYLCSLPQRTADRLFRHPQCRTRT